MQSVIATLVCNQLRLSPGIADDSFCTPSIRMADDDRLIVDHLLSRGGGRLTDGRGILVISIEQELSTHTAAEAARDFPHFNVLHEAVVNELGLI